MASYGRSSLTENRAPARDDAYTVMLSISLLAMIGACVILFYDLKRFPSLKPDAASIKVPAAAPINPEPPPGEAPPAPAPGGNPPAPANPPAPGNPGGAGAGAAPAPVP